MTVLRKLLAAYPRPISGEEIATALGISRAAVWKQMQKLQKLGLKIEGRQNSGYKLLEWPDLLLPELIGFYLAGNLGRHIVWQDSLASTNTTAKELARQGAAHGTLVVAEEQTAGRGRRGRTWISTKGSGIFASLILRPRLPARRVPMLTLAAGVALVEALHAYGLTNAWLKWPNDVWVGNRKLAGILSELSGELDQVDFVVIGMGVNVQHTQLPAEMAAKTTSFYQETQKTQNRAELVARILLELEQILPLLEQTDVTPLLQAWQKHDRLQGKEVNVIETTEQYSGTVLGITPTGALRIALPGGSTKEVLAGDVSIRPSR
ncbi:MAG: biotin--[acetyl-CoA-carboxylase] ligase [Firmicutes bacterium]|nr:biotin--[acetyl-CoA-carboxylase] ligase [Bacillota bacterium]